MLYTETVGAETLTLLKKIMGMPELTNFYLVGGTALSLKLGHRISVDLDLFQVSKFEPSYLVNTLLHEFRSK
jgi:hypothetical protein